MYVHTVHMYKHKPVLWWGNREMQKRRWEFGFYLFMWVSMYQQLLTHHSYIITAKKTNKKKDEKTCSQWDIYEYNTYVMYLYTKLYE